ncbi:hypothetical protein [Hyphomonas sp. CACIAM 19H1]|uniref:hypothetical protein n=1 Tax=Hyphomonas sp. CACIAM 19H1 TaxID=1873716 RepID=UPI0013B04ABB|nr:hypothetical protein [Hyphomonas sp. CACIAM 19H1]
MRWLTDADLRFPGVGGFYDPPSGRIVGAQTHDHWVIFHGLQVVLIVPEEEHSAWHLEFRDQQHKMGCAWRMRDSVWKESFTQRHISDEHSHFVLQFHDEVVELICRDLLFGHTPFDLAAAIDSHPRLAYPYFQLAASLENQGDKQGAIINYEKYLQLESDSRSAEYVRRTIDKLRRG